MKKTFIYIVLAKNTDKTERAFVYRNKQKANKVAAELLADGWEDSYVQTVDCIMIDTIKIS